MPVRAHTLQAINIIVFVAKHLTPLLRNVESDHVATGISNLIGNKGGVGVGFILGNTSFLFVGCHLAAGQKGSKRRNADFRRINKKLKLPQNKKAREKLSTEASNRYDVCFWMGDLNYRIDGKKEAVKLMLEKEQYDSLLACD